MRKSPLLSRRTIPLTLLAIMAGWTSVQVPASAATLEITNVSLGVGSDQTQRNLAWYSSANDTEVAQLAPASAMTGTDFPVFSAKSFSTSESGVSTASNYFEHATITGLAPNTTYVYRVGGVNGWSDTYRFSTQATDDQTNFLFVGDPQMGSSGNVTNDQAGWQTTVTAATAAMPNADFLLSAGDQVESATNESQYAAFLAPSELKSLPLATTIGNHDVGSRAYQQHFDRPNVDGTYGAASSSSQSGGDYWFTNDNTMFLVLNSNITNNDAHKAFLQQTIAAHGAESKWKVVVFHHSIYSTASHAKDSDIIARRAALAPIFSDLGVDLALMGHDHVYTRSWLINDGTVAEDTTKGAQADLKAKSGQVLYVTGNSASGSKYYSLSGSYDWTAATNQDGLPSYTKVNITASAITLETVRTGDGSTIDKTVLQHADETKPVITLPAENTVTYGSTFDALTGVSATDNTDGDLTGSISVTGSVNASAIGDYSLVYSVTDAAGNTTSATRNVNVVAGNLTAANPSIAGQVAVGLTVSAEAGEWTPNASFSYQWLADGAAISGATGKTLYLSPNLAGKTLSVQVAGAATGYTTLTKTSPNYLVAKASFGKKAKPGIKGTLRNGKRLSVKVGTWSPKPSFSYQWYANGKAIKGAKFSSLKLTRSVVGKRITVKVTATKAGYATVTVASSATSKVKR
jgi:hypothetical protein